MPPKTKTSTKTILTTLLILTSITLFIFYSSLLSLTSFSPSSPQPTKPNPKPKRPNCSSLFKGKWVFDPTHQKPIYDETCPFHRNAWNCNKNKRANMGRINNWRWVPEEKDGGCELRKIDPLRFLSMMRDKSVGFVGDSLNENFLVAFLCVLRKGDKGAKKWKRRGAWRGGYFPKFNVTVAYHRAVLLANYQWQPNQSDQDGVKGIYRVDVDIPADDWVNITKFYDVLIFNTGHWWGDHKFPKETPLVFYQGGQPIVPALNFLDGLNVVLKSMISYVEKEVPSSTLKFWRLQSPRHFFGGEWNQNGSCLFDEPLKESQ